VPFLERLEGEGLARRLLDSRGLALFRQTPSPSRRKTALLLIDPKARRLELASARAGQRSRLLPKA
jgi:hypothetical protein